MRSNSNSRSSNGDGRSSNGNRGNCGGGDDVTSDADMGICFSIGIGIGIGIGICFGVSLHKMKTGGCSNQAGSWEDAGGGLGALLGHHVGAFGNIRGLHNSVILDVAHLGLFEMAGLLDGDLGDSLATGDRLNMCVGNSNPKTVEGIGGRSSKGKSREKEKVQHVGYYPSLVVGADRIVARPMSGWLLIGCNLLSGLQRLL